ncbi:MAG: AmmeMemoRadiSam system protein B [Candidatus Micrarchaeia archaeon]
MRKYKFADYFYPSDKRKLLEFINWAYSKAEVGNEAAEAKAYVAPHAGYSYSGVIAAYTYKALLMKKDLDKLDTIIIIGPNHTGLGEAVSISKEDWETPFGVYKNDIELSLEIGKKDSMSIDEEAHKEEHSIEVQLPFLDSLRDTKKFCFICMGDQSLEYSQKLAEAIVNSAAKLNRNITVIASSDFNHYEAASIASEKDGKLLEALQNIDYKSFNKLVEETADTICGFGPITVALLFAKSRNARKGVILKYGNSGDTTGEYESVVAYASIAFV